MTPLVPVGGRLAVLVTAAALLAGSVAPPHRHAVRTTARPVPTTVPVARLPLAAPVRRNAHAAPALAVPTALTPAGLDLRAAPIALPLRLRIPSIGVDVAVIGVGMTSGNVMDAPEGPANDPVWQQAFWYRGSAVPGARSTALFAGHIDDPLGRPGTFARIGELRPGDRIVVHDQRSGLDVQFAVTASVSYPLAQTTDPAVLRRMYGAGPVAGTGPRRSRDGLAHLTLVTCAGIFQHSIGTHDHRLAVYATRVS